MIRFLFILFTLIQALNLYSQNKTDGSHHASVVLIDTIITEKIIFDTVAVTDTIIEYVDDEEVIIKPDTKVPNNNKKVPSTIKRPRFFSLALNAGLISWFGKPSVNSWMQSSNIGYNNMISFNPSIHLNIPVNNNIFASFGLSFWSVKFKLQYSPLFETNQRQYYSYFQNSRIQIDTIGIDSLGHPIASIRLIYFNDSIQNTRIDTIKSRSSLSTVNSYYILELPVNLSYSFFQNKKLNLSVSAGFACAFLFYSKGNAPAEDIYVYKKFNKTSFSIPYIRVYSGFYLTYKAFKKLSFSLESTFSYTISINKEILPSPEYLVTLSPGILYSF